MTGAAASSMICRNPTTAPVVQGRPPQPSTVLLGPHIDLHAGYHGSIRRSPPAFIEIHARGGDHVFGFPDPSKGSDPFAPFDRPHLGELVDFGPGPQVVHSPRWPVLRRRAWTVDLDDLGYPAVLGRHVFSTRFRHGDDSGWCDSEREIARQRFANYLTAFSHPSCRAVLFWTQRSLDLAVERVARAGLEDLAEGLWCRSRVLYPAQRPLRRSLVLDKWQSPGPTHVLFVGNDYAVKQGSMALRLFSRLSQERPGVRFSYAGSLPDAVDVPAVGVELLGEISREQLLTMMVGAHVLFHPARTESFGMVLLEAAAHALAIIVGSGVGMEHVEELLRPSEACFVERRADTSPKDEEEAFEAALRHLLDSPAKAREIGLAAHRRIADGPFNPVARNQHLEEIWRSAAREAAPAPLLLSDLPYWEPAGEMRVRSRDLRISFCDYVQQHAIDGRNFYFRSPWT